jgi:hypothetical protein
VPIEPGIIKSEKLTKSDVEHLDKLLEEIEKSNPSMPPEIYQPEATIELETNHGSQSLDSSVLTKEGLKKLKRFKTQDDLEGAEKILHDYMDGTKLESFDIVEGGWIAHLSMPGYMDQTEPTRYETLKEAIESLHEQYADME